MAELAEVDADAPGLRCKCTEAWGKPGLGLETLGGTFAVSFLLSAESEAGAIPDTPETDGAFGADGGIDAEGITVPGGLETSGGAPANEEGLGATGETPTTEGGFGAKGTAGGALGAGGATPAIEGGLGAAGGATNGIPGGFGRGGNSDAASAEAGAETEPGATGF
jgi:autotransporter family porin